MPAMRRPAGERLAARPQRRSSHVFRGNEAKRTSLALGSSGSIVLATGHPSSVEDGRGLSRKAASSQKLRSRGPSARREDAACAVLASIDVTSRRRLRVLLACVLTLPTACSVVIDPGITYCDRSKVINDFSDPSFDALSTACWHVGNTDAEHAEIFLDSGDLVVRANPPATGVATWSNGVEGAFAYQPFDDDFVMIVRVEAVNQISGDHCLDEGNGAGLVVRARPTAASDGGDFATLLVAPFTPEPPPTDADCHAGSTTYPPTRATMASSLDAWGGPVHTDGVEQRGIGVDGEADLAVCRLNDVLAFFVRDPTSDPALAKWQRLGDYTVGDEAFDVGLTAAGAPPTFASEGHFTWAAYTEKLPADGCQGALESLLLPPFE